MKSFVSFAFLFCTVIAMAQPKPFAASVKQKVALKSQAEACANAMTVKNYKQMATYTYPPIVKQMGGPDKLVAKLTASMAQMKSMGVEIKSASIGEVKTIYQSQGDLYCIVQDVLQLSNNGTLFTSSTYLLAYSHNKGERWYFTDVAPLRKQDPKKLFPTYPSGFVLPDVQGPGSVK